jgi:hypothetical protein
VLFHPEIESAVFGMKLEAEKRAKDEAERFNAKVEGLRQAYVANVTELNRLRGSGLEREHELNRAGLGEHIGITVEGYGSFLWSPVKWQEFIWRELLIPNGSNREIRAIEVKERLKTHGAIRRQFAFVRRDIEQALLATKIGFLPPYKAVEAYLIHLQRAALSKTGSPILLRQLVRSLIGLNRFGKRIVTSRKKPTTFCDESTEF